MAKHYQGSPATTTTDAVFIPEVWASGIYKYFERKTVFRNLVDDYSALVSGSADTIHVPEIGVISATAKSAGSDVSYDATASTTTDLSVNKHYYAAKLFEDLLTVQSSYDLMSKYAKMFGEALARQVDSDIWGELDGVNQTQALSADDTLTAAVFEATLATLGENDVPYMDGDCYMVVNPTLFADIMNPSAGLAQYFIRQDASGDGSGLRNGMVGSLYGIQVFMSNTVSTAGSSSTVPGGIFHKSACAFAMQRDVRVQSEYSVDALGTKVVADTIYGVKVLDDSDNIRGVRFLNVD
jgi:hypothetical protein|tara:strand:+ start:1503 stop:2390 length:888 start_codon:yes stop_codon:yes gene_type:complete